jgi:tetratricopeptide (TPR) repeat protein
MLQKKWDAIDDGESEDAQEVENQLVLRKLSADLIFANAESDPTLFKTSLDVYADVIISLQTRKSSQNLSNLWVPCHLNKATCYFKLSMFEDCIQICNSMLNALPCELLAKQLIRCHFLLGSSFISLRRNDSDVQRAQISSSTIQNMILNNPDDFDDRSDYDELHNRILKYLQPDYSGWELLKLGRYQEASKWFTHAIGCYDDNGGPLDLAGFHLGLAKTFVKLEFYEKVCTK